MTEEKKKDNTMEYRLLGGTGLYVSVLGYGYFATFGVKEEGKDRIDTAVKNSLPVIRAARNAGVNFFDNAEEYGQRSGDAELVMGKGLALLQFEDPVKYRRSDLVLTTKLYWGGKGLNEVGLSKKHIREGMETSLKRLGVSYVDIVFCHRPDPLTSIRETVRGMNELLKSGKALYWGTSEWSAQEITEAYWVASEMDLEGPCCEQCEYNLFRRERMEKEYLGLFAGNIHVAYNMGTTIWGPLCSGWLTGKYNDIVPEESRLDTYKWMAEDMEKKRRERVDKVKALQGMAETKFGTSCTVLAIAWVLKNGNVSVCLLGASKVWQIEENLTAMSVAKRLTDEDMEEIEVIFGTKPEKDFDWGRSSVVQKIRRYDFGELVTVKKEEEEEKK